MRKLVAFLVVVLLVAVAVEIFVPSVVEGRIEKRVAAATSGVGRAEADIDSFPVVTSVLLTGSLRHVTITLHDVERGGLRYRTLRFDLEEVKLERGSLLSGQARIRSIRRGVITAEVPAQVVLEAAAPIRRPSGFPEVDATLDDIRVEDGDLVLGGGPLPLVHMALPPDLFPCDPSATVTGRSIRIRCTVAPVPEALLRAYGVLGS